MKNEKSQIFRLFEGELTEHQINFVFNIQSIHPNHEVRTVVTKEKESYNQCKDYSVKELGLRVIEIIGIFIREQGSTPKFSEEFRKKFELKTI